ncbi:hypothetical protein EJ05DRAFT_21963 [Pseudovirgaria hyperparasitica]|uniref:Uncharacterized protein n=1 Tax=Pseudovirgaria hyperparasitica TaxID=470096 RepID=A0A6A6WL98_9PEZI|nr:uncharacterized protein EJ05DRAFT_21963 [Pseudovirgaria hyperparasitica]KAF2762967.1 hypothetical protein EJ05DRAFT_21963 [Pseudovirgaria hyperparasitica]
MGCCTTLQYNMSKFYLYIIAFSSAPTQLYQFEEILSTAKLGVWPSHSTSNGCQLNVTCCKAAKQARTMIKDGKDRRNKSLKRCITGACEDVKNKAERLTSDGRVERTLHGRGTRSARPSGCSIDQRSCGAIDGRQLAPPSPPPPPAALSGSAPST